jgi:hypothetical protein
MGVASFTKLDNLKTILQKIIKKTIKTIKSAQEKILLLDSHLRTKHEKKSQRCFVLQ